LSEWLGCTQADLEKILFLSEGDNAIFVAMQPFASKIKEWETSSLFEMVVKLKTLQTLNKIETNSNEILENIRQEQ
jgi:hypothetical protein